MNDSHCDSGQTLHSSFSNPPSVFMTPHCFFAASLWYENFCVDMAVMHRKWLFYIIFTSGPQCSEFFILWTGFLNFVIYRVVGKDVIFLHLSHIYLTHWDHPAWCQCDYAAAKDGCILLLLCQCLGLGSLCPSAHGLRWKTHTPTDTRFKICPHTHTHMHRNTHAQNNYLSRDSTQSCWMPGGFKDTYKSPNKFTENQVRPCLRMPNISSSNCWICVKKSAPGCVFLVVFKHWLHSDSQCWKNTWVFDVSFSLLFSS